MSDIVHAVLRGTHVGLGFAGLALFWWIVARPKGTNAHRRAGRAFVWIAYIVGGTALVSSLWAVIDVDSFAPIIGKEASPERRDGLRELFRFLFLILLYLSAATLAGAVFGMRLVRYRERLAELRRTSVPWWQALSMACAMLLVAFGTWRLISGAPTNGMLPRAAYQVPLYLGLFGVAAGVREIRFVFRREHEPRSWLFKHIETLLGTGTAFHTAFIVFGAGRLFGFQIDGVWALVPWVAPPLIGTALTGWYLRRVRRG